ncbi:M24 family metallopeptidase [Rossellomorea marisflavi]|uniref:M24 family metallopeptidase n=2 Tax=Rossellomorea marisflavi TaxID=189381 RepID=A0A5D4RN49_9BACI|nr:M24 family metallopeptidase [Rossellomorea marisflavi]
MCRTFFHENHEKNGSGQMNLFQQKVKALRKALAESHTKAVLLTQQKNVSWLTGGRSHVNPATERAVASILLTGEDVTLFVNNIESKRLIEEEFGSHFDDVREFPWYEPLSLEGYTTDQELEGILQPLRTVVLSGEKEEVKTFGIETGAAIESAAFHLTRGMTEFEVAGIMARACWERGIEPVVNLVAADRRVFTRRHPLPTNTVIDEYVMLVLCGRRNGRFMSVSRLVHFGNPGGDLTRRHEAVTTIDARMINGTRSGADFAHLFSEMKQAYEDTGFPDEWTFHHQGGLSGFASREQLLLPGLSAKHVKNDQIYAWNPSIAGVKSEDTILVEDEPKILTFTGDFPVETVQLDGAQQERPAILVRRRL